MLHGYGQLHSPCETQNIHVELAGDVKIRFDTSNYEVKRTLRIEKKKKRSDER